MTEEFKERCFYILRKQGFPINPLFKGFIEECQSKGITAILKEVGAWKTTGARQTRTTWANPYIWVMIAMEMNPELYERESICPGRILGCLAEGIECQPRDAR